MPILTNKMRESRYAAWDNVRTYFPCHESNVEDLTDVTGDVTIAAADVARTDDYGVDAVFGTTAPPTTGDVGFTVNSSFILVAAGRVSINPAFFKLAFGSASSDDWISITGSSAVARFGSGASSLSSLAFPAVSSGETAIFAAVYDASARTWSVYNGKNGGAVTLGNQQTGLSAALTPDFVLTNNIILHQTSFPQPTFGAALLTFNAVPTTLVDDLFLIEKKWSKGITYLPESWKNA